MNGWTRHGEWRPESGPWYRHDTGRVAISGEYGTVGDNVRGWRKTRFYGVIVIGEDGTTKSIRSCRSIKAAKVCAEKLLSG